MKNLNVKKIITLCLVFTMLLTSTVLAVDFTDVDNHWAKEEIEKMASKGIIKGNPDGTFKPDDNVKLLEAFIMMSRMYNIEDEVIKDEINDYYKDFLIKASDGKYEWAYEGLSIALAANIVLKSSLEYYFSSGKINEKTTKEEICTFLTKAMILDDEAKNLEDYTLDFDDESDISSIAAPYVYTMYDKGIIKGDTSNKINPKSKIKRAVMATMLSRSIEYMEDNDVKPDFSSFINNLTTVEGNILDIINGDETSYIKIEADDNSEKLYKVNNDTYITIDGKSGSIESLSTGMNTECKVDEDYVVRSIKAEVKTKGYEGKINFVHHVSPAEIGLTIEEDNEEERISFKVIDDVDLLLDGNSAELSELNTGDIASVKVRDNKIYEIEAEKRTKIYNGVFTKLLYEAPIKVSFVDDNDNTYEIEIASDIEVKRNNKNTSLDNLKNGDEVKITTVYGLITEISSTAVESECEGDITEIIFGEEVKITIKGEDNQSAEYIVDKDADISIDDKVFSIYDLRVGYHVEFELEGKEITDIEATAVNVNIELSGIVSYVNEDVGVIMLNVKDDKGENEQKVIEVSDSTKIGTLYLKSKRLKDIEQGNEILCIGNYEGGLFTAISIIIK